MLRYLLEKIFSNMNFTNLAAKQQMQLQWQSLSCSDLSSVLYLQPEKFEEPSPLVQTT